MSQRQLIRVRPQIATSPDDEIHQGPVSPGDVLGLRSYRIGAYDLKSPELARLWGGTTSTGISVSEQNAMALSAVWAAVTMIADDIASLPLHLYKRLPTGGKDRYEAHPLYRLLHDAPNPEMDSMVFRRTLQTHALIWQNAYAEIERDGAGRPVAVWPLVPESVDPYRNQAGVLVYRVRNPSGTDITIAAADMLHLVGYSHDGSVGSSLVRMARESLSLGLAAERFGGSFFGNGATFGGVISFKGPKPPEMADENYRASLNARHQGVQRAHNILTLYNEAKFEQFGVEPDKAQFLETRVFQVREVARWFKIPPHKLADLADATFSNVEQQNLDYYSSCLRPWLTLWEQQLTRKLVARLERSQQFIEHDTHGFLSADAAGRAALYATEGRIGSVTPNEIRGYENRDPITGGDEGFVSADLIPLSKVGPYWDALIEAKKREATAPVAPDPNNAPGGADDRAIVVLNQAISSLTVARDAEATEKRQAIQRSEDLAAALAYEQEQRETAEATLSQTIELLDGAKTALAAAEAERARESAVHSAAVDDLTAKIADRDAVVATVTAERDEAIQRATGAEAESHRHLTTLLEAAESYQQGIAAITAERDALQATVADRDAVLAQRDASIAARDLAIEEAAKGLTALTEQRDEALSLAAGFESDLRAEAEARANDKVEAIKAVTGIAEERDAEKARADAAETQAREAAAAHQAEAATLTAELDTIRAELAEIRATLPAQVAAAVAEAAQATEAKTAAEQARMAAEAEREEAIRQADVAKTQAIQEAEARHAAQGTVAALQAELRETRENHAARVNGILVAHRGLVVDVMRRMVEREIDRARRHQTTLPKFRAWVDSFYQTHAAAVEEALLPAVRAHLSILSSSCDPHELARQLAEDHVAESAKQLRDLLHVEDFAPMLERTLAQWESSRPEMVADRLLTKGLADVR